jgi:ubiquinol-cytochrome c reductase iron-sulfur subunit
MSCDEKVDCGRRRLLVATATVGGVAGVAAAVPFVASMLPSERAKAAGAPVEVDISKLAPGPDDDRRVARQAGLDHQSHQGNAGLRWRRSATSWPIPKSDKNMQPEYAKNETRSIKPEILVAVGICTHLGCSPTEKFKTGAESGVDPNWPGGFLCPCHGSTFDLAGRVYKSKPAPDNLEIPPHMYLGDAKLDDWRRQEGLTR